ncbi:MAG: type II toxin-antitoxin system RelE/ParE family toxin [Okeania sp. SIO3C4]|nr:type II toxin-antitoxin system RelE/ParE family toxin [Okeania sp. SIO3C4]
MTQIKLTRRANFDLVDIYDFSVEKWGVSVADNYITGLQKALLLLQENPEILIQNPKVSSRFQCYRYQKHWLMCETISDVIIILTVLHSSSSILENLKKYEPSLETEAEILYRKLKG